MDEENKNDKTFMENAKGFLKTWKDDYADKNKEILERKKKRDEEAEKEHQEFLKNLEAVKSDLKGKAEKLANVLNREFEGFMKSLEEGTATVHEKFQLQKHYDDFKGFLKKLEKTGTEKFAVLTQNVGKNLAEVDTKKLAIEPPKSQNTNEFDEIMKQAESLMSENDAKMNEVEKNANDVNKLFDDLNK
jgi:hypothetical protein